MDSTTLKQLVWEPEESAKLDFKIELYKIHEPKPTTQSDVQRWAEDKEKQWAELIKDVIALANGNVGTASQTGHLIVGADDKLKTDGTPTLRDVGNIVPTRKEILEKLNSYCYPQLPDLQCDEVVVDGIKLFVISIPPSPYLYRLSKQLKTPKKEYSPHTVLIRRGDGERTYEASPDEQKAIEQEKQAIYPHPSAVDTERLFQKELEEVYIQVPSSVLTAPYWHIVISPQTYNSNLLASRSDCTHLIDTSKIKIQGWSYPRNSGMHIKGANWIGVQTDLIRHEYWRLYQSGQFVNISGTWSNTSNNIITDGEIIYTVTSVFTFAESICQKEIYARGTNITIGLNNVQDFGLKLDSDLNDLPSQYRRATDNKYQRTWAIEKSDLSSGFEEEACEAIVWFIESFGSEPLIPVEIFKKKRKELLDG